MNEVPHQGPLGGVLAGLRSCPGRTGLFLAVDLVTDRTYENFELRLQWKVEKAGNSGIMFNVIESDEFAQTWHSGPEIQILDNDNHPDAKEKHLAGDLYDLLPGWLHSRKAS